MNKDFYFLGKAPLSKSLLNRALIIKSWFPDFKILGTSSCDDIKVMEKAVSNLNTDIFCGLSASAFRFLALRLSREQGEFVLKVEPSLFRRLSEEGEKIFFQLGVDYKKEDQAYRIISQGWRPTGDYINIPYEVTSQYASGLLLSGWNLKKDIYFSINRNQVSLGYFKMTLGFVRSLGLEVKESNHEYMIPRGQTLSVFEYEPEQDQNCLFVLSAFAALGGRACFLDWKEDSLQPEACFPDLLERMGVPLSKENGKLSIFKAKQLKPISVNLKSMPDLFPVLAVLASQAEGVSHFSGLKHLAFKESNRLDKLHELLSQANIQVEKNQDSLSVYGKKTDKTVQSFDFFSNHDHRMIMAASLLKKSGTALVLKDKSSVNKSFPDFFNLI